MTSSDQTSRSSRPPMQLEKTELEAEQAVELPDREEMSIISPIGGGWGIPLPPVQPGESTI